MNKREEFQEAINMVSKRLGLFPYELKEDTELIIDDKSIVINSESQEKVRYNIERFLFSTGQTCHRRTGLWKEHGRGIHYNTILSVLQNHPGYMEAWCETGLINAWCEFLYKD